MLGGSVRPKSLKNCIKLILEFPEGWGGLRNNPLRGEGKLDIFWNYTLHENIKHYQKTTKKQVSIISLVHVYIESKLQIYLPFHVAQLVKSLLLCLPEACKR